MEKEAKTDAKFSLKHAKRKRDDSCFALKRKTIEANPAHPNQNHFVCLGANHDGIPAAFPALTYLSILSVSLTGERVGMRPN